MQKSEFTKFEIPGKHKARKLHYLKPLQELRFRKFGISNREIHENHKISRKYIQQGGCII